MIKRFAYIVLILLFALRLSYAGTIKSRRNNLIFLKNGQLTLMAFNAMPKNTLTEKKLKQQQQEEEKKKNKGNFKS